MKPPYHSFSVVMNAYNTIKGRGQDTLIQALQSVEDSISFFKKDYPNADAIHQEIVFVDDASTDATFDVAREFCRKKDFYWLVRHPKNFGPGKARNTAVRTSRGQVIFFCDHDDVFLESHISICFKAMNVPIPLNHQRPDRYPGEYPGAIQTGVRITENIHPFWKKAIENSLVINLCVRRDVHAFIGGFPEEEEVKRRGGAEDAMYSGWIHRFISYGEIEQETVEHKRHTGNSLDEQLGKFRLPPSRDCQKRDSEERQELKRISLAIMNERIQQLDKKIKNWKYSAE